MSVRICGQFGAMHWAWESRWLLSATVHALLSRREWKKISVYGLNGWLRRVIWGREETRECSKSWGCPPWLPPSSQFSTAVELRLQLFSFFFFLSPLFHLLWGMAQQENVSQPLLSGMSHECTIAEKHLQCCDIWHSAPCWRMGEKKRNQDALEKYAKMILRRFVSSYPIAITFSWLFAYRAIHVILPHTFDTLGTMSLKDLWLHCGFCVTGGKNVGE